MPYRRRGSTFGGFDLQGVEGVERSVCWLERKNYLNYKVLDGVFEHAWGLVGPRTRVLDRGVQLPFAGGLHFTSTRRLVNAHWQPTHGSARESVF